MKSQRTYQCIEGNKPDVFACMDRDMASVLELDLRNCEILREQHPSLTDEKAFYALARRFWNQDAPEVYAKENLLTDGPYGKLPVRLYRAEAGGNRPCLLYFHGGGFAVGSPDTHDGIASRLCLETRAHVLSVDYRLAPEYPYPTAVEEGVFAARYLRAHARELGIDADRIGFAGDSAGAYLSLATFLELRDGGEDISFVKSLLLYYGSVGLSDSLSRRLYGGTWDGLTGEDLDRYEAMFFGGAKDRMCLLEHDLGAAMPPVHIEACELDPLLDDSQALYAILRGKGHEAEIRIHKGYVHAFLHYAGRLPGAGEAIRTSAEFFRRHAKT